MFIKNWKQEILTVPNLLSLFRLLLIPVYVTIYMNASQPRDHFIAGAVLAVSCLTDAVDGKIARKFNQITHFGKLLDPFADKATQFVLTICLSLRYPVLNPVLVLFLVKECFQLVACILSFRKGKMLPGALPAGKVCTAVLFVSLIILVLFPDLDWRIVNAVALLNGCFLLLSFISYILAYYGKKSKVQDVNF